MSVLRQLGEISAVSRLRSDQRKCDIDMVGPEKCPCRPLKTWAYFEQKAVWRHTHSTLFGVRALAE
jgi:hypothetical protein